MDEPILEGIGVHLPGGSNWQASGKVRIVDNKHSAGFVQDGEIMVANHTTPEMVIHMKRAAAIITEIGGRTSHAAIIGRSYGKPCVVGTGNALSKLVTGQVVSVNAQTGTVWDATDTVVEQRRRYNEAIEAGRSKYQRSGD